MVFNRGFSLKMTFEFYKTQERTPSISFSLLFFIMCMQRTTLWERACADIKNGYVLMSFNEIHFKFISIFFIKYRITHNGKDFKDNCLLFIPSVSLNI